MRNVFPIFVTQAQQEIKRACNNLLSPKNLTASCYLHGSVTSQRDVLSFAFQWDFTAASRLNKELHSEGSVFISASTMVRHVFVFIAQVKCNPWVSLNYTQDRFNIDWQSWKDRQTDRQRHSAAYTFSLTNDRQDIRHISTYNCRIIFQWPYF